MSLLATTTHAGIVFLVEHTTEENVIPVCIDSAQTVDALLSLLRKSIPPTGNKEVILTQFIKHISHTTLMSTIIIPTLQEIQLKVHLFIGIKQVQSINAGTRTVC